MEFIFCLRDRDSRRVFKEDTRMASAVDPFNESVAAVVPEGGNGPSEEFLQRTEQELSANEG